MCSKSFEEILTPCQAPVRFKRRFNVTLLFTCGSFNQLWSGEKGPRLADTRVLPSALCPGLTAVILTAVVLIKFSRTQIKSLILAVDVLFIQLFLYFKSQSDII